MNHETVVNNLIDILFSTQFKSNPNGFCAQDKNNTRKNVKTNTENSFYNTIKGFRGELEYAKELKSRFNTFPGGWFVATSYGEQNPLQDGAVYFTVTNNAIDKLLPIYSILSDTFSEIEFYVLHVPNAMREFKFELSSFCFYRFDKDARQFLVCDSSNFFSKFSNKSKAKRIEKLEVLSSVNSALYQDCVDMLKGFSTEDLYSLLIDRYFYDVLLSGTKWKGNSTDIDGINYYEDKNIINFLDIKYKTRNNNMVGHNISHLPFWLELHAKVKLKNIDRGLKVATSYVLRDIDCTDEKGFWKWTSMHRFEQFGVIVKGGNGRGDDYITKMIDVEKHFKIVA